MRMTAFMKIYFNIFLATLTLLLIGYGCASSRGNNEGSELGSRFDTIMAIHDEVMPQMGNIHTLKKQLSNYLETVLADTTENPSEALKAIAKYQSDLEEADRLMMDWMHEFDQDWKKKAPKEAMLYLNEEKKRIEIVKRSMRRSISAAEKYLSQIKN